MYINESQLSIDAVNCTNDMFNCSEPKVSMFTLDSDILIPRPVSGNDFIAVISIIVLVVILFVGKIIAHKFNLNGMAISLRTKRPSTSYRREDETGLSRGSILSVHKQKESAV